MLTLILTVICFVLTFILSMLIVKIRPIYRELTKLQKINNGFSQDQKEHFDGIVNTTKVGLDKVDHVTREVRVDPLFTDLQATLKSRTDFLSSFLVRLLEGSQVILGITSGLLGMSIVAVIFHFMRTVGDFESSHFFESVSYAVFFTCVCLGIFSNRYFHRKIQRAENKLLQAELSHQEQLENLKQSYEDILIENKTEMDHILSANEKIAQQFSTALEERRTIIAQLESNQKKRLVPQRLQKIFQR